MGKTFNMVGGGANVVANPAMTGTEIDLQGLEVSGTKYKVPLIRPNLLDNWYFVGGGSQQGGGQFPINQRGQTSYSPAAYTIDRWYSRAYLTPSFVSGGLKLQVTAVTPTNSYAFFTQRIENYQQLLGKTVTLSMLIDEISGNFGGVRFSLTPANSIVANSQTLIPTQLETSPGLFSATGKVPDTISYSGMNIAFYFGYTANLTIGDYAVIKAAKLELGYTQTLAHNEGTEANPVWVLNEIPNYTEELWKCQRYYQLFESSAYRPTYGEDYRPPMRLHSPSKGTISIGGTTYYYADANL